MKIERNEVTVEELLNLIQSKEGEFIIHVELEEGETHGNTEYVSA